MAILWQDIESWTDRMMGNAYPSSLLESRRVAYAIANDSGKTTTLLRSNIGRIESMLVHEARF